jgi:arginyl-tRNA--protein-N-Asp/Glu arginylyltransferase
MQSREIVVFDSFHPCSYLPGRTARLPYRYPLTKLTGEQFDQRLSEGDRRNGVHLYRTHCPSCQSCQPIRLDVSHFQPDATQRRMQRKGDALLEVRIASPVIDDQRVKLFNLHRDVRGLAQQDRPIDDIDYANFLTDTCVETQELTYWHAGQLVAVAIADMGARSISAVYCYYDPTFRLLSLGTYSVLRQVELCRATSRQYLYLGFYIAESPHMSYKARFLPHQRLINGDWTTIE